MNVNEFMNGGNEKQMIEFLTPVDILKVRLAVAELEIKELKERVKQLEEKFEGDHK